LAEALAKVEGISIVSTGSNVQIPIIHGLYGNRISILNNGLKHGFQNWGSDHAPEIDIAAAHNITVLKGAAGVRYGPEALGGAINVKTNPLHLNEPFYTNVQTTYQSNGRGIGASLETGQATEKLSYFIGGKYNKIGDLHAPDYALTNSGKEEIAANAGLRYYTGDWDFKVHYSFVDQELALLRSSIADSGNAFVRALNEDIPTFVRPFSYEIGEPNQETQHQLGKAEVKWWYSDHGKLTFKFGTQLNNRKEFDVRRNIEKPIIDLTLLTNDYQIEWKHPDWKKLDGIIGLQLFTQNNDNNPGTGTTAFIPNYNSIRYSAFVIENLKTDKHTFEVGLRFDFENNDIRGRESN
jgi:iron complex outermembrane receptor protein